MSDPTPLPTENKVATKIDDVIAAGETPAAQAIEKAAEASQGWLAFPVIKQLFEGFVSWLVAVFDKTGQVLTTFVVVKGEGKAENSELLAADDALKAALASGDPMRIADAEAKLQAAQSKAANSDGWARPK